MLKTNLYKDTGWETLSERRKKHKILKFHEMFHKKGPEYLNQMVPQQNFEVHNYNTRRTNDTQNVNCRASYYKHSFLPWVVSLWNTIPQCVRSNYSKAAIKSYLNENVITIPKYFLYGSRKGQILHIRLRIRNSCLNDHLFHCNLSNTKLCAWGQIETIKHSLLECPNYTFSGYIQ